jgi:putative nucleotidyltransferase with HDIG domain
MAMSLARNIRKGFMFLDRGRRIDAEDTELLARYLSDAERDAFLRMDDPDQVHSVRVARLCAEALEGFPELDESVVMKAALLHDIGKTGEDLGLLFRTLWVMGHRVAPAALDRFARGSIAARPGTVRRKLYAQVEHALLGAELLSGLGTEAEVIALVRATGEEWDEELSGLAITLLLTADQDKVLTARDWRGMVAR